MTKYLKILQNSDIFPENKIKKPKKYQKRQTVKAIVINNKKEVALATNAVHHFFILPGGGAESSNLESERKRECRKKINKEIQITSIVGKTKEFRDRDAKEYIITCFLAKTVKYVKEDNRTEKEIKNDLRVVWVNKKKLKSILKTQNKKVISGKVTFYNTAFNIVRDKIFINEWLKTQIAPKALSVKK